MKNILIILSMILIFSTEILSKNMFLTPLNESTTTYKNSTSKLKASEKLELGKIYETIQSTKSRFLLKDLNVWVNKSDVSYELSKGVINYKAQYLLKYKDDKIKEAARRKSIVDEHPEWSSKVKSDVLAGLRVPNWPESLVVASWGKPNKRAVFTNKEGKKETRILYGQKLLIFENDSLKYEKDFFTGSLAVHLEKKNEVINNQNLSINDSTLMK